MKKILIIIIALVIASVGTGFFISNISKPSIVDMYEYYMDGVVIEEKYSKITREEAETIAVKEGPEKYNIDINNYKYMESNYWSNGTWHILFYNDIDVLDDGFTLVVDENTKHLAILIP